MTRAASGLGMGAVHRQEAFGPPQHQLPGRTMLSDGSCQRSQHWCRGERDAAGSPKLAVALLTIPPAPSSRPISPDPVRHGRTRRQASG